MDPFIINILYIYKKDTSNSQEEAKTAVQLIHDATELSRNIPALQSEKLKSVTGKIIVVLVIHF